MSNHKGTELNFLLGTEYEKKKQQLHEELQMDYKRYINQKRDPKAGVYHKSQYQELSLPISERTSEKEKLREERKREYNLFLKEQAKTRRRGQLDVPSKDEGPYDFDKVHKYTKHSSTESYKIAEPSTSRKDAATLTDIIRRKNSGRTWDLSHRRAFLSRQDSSSDEKFYKDSEEEIEFSHRKKPNGQIHMSKYMKEGRRTKRVPVNMKYDEVFIDENNNDQNWKSVTPHITDKQAMAERPIPNSTAAAAARGFATGLLIGHSEEQDILQKKKEQYKQALLSQIAEQRENKRKEKIFELQVAATGVKDPHRFGPEHRTYEKWKKGVSSKSETGAIAAKDNPELKHFPDSNVRKEQREPPGRPNIAFSSPTRDDHCSTKSGAGHRSYSPDTSVEEYKSFSQMIGDVTAKMVSAVLPPLPPRVDHTFRTPHDEAYNYYGSRHPLEPVPSYNQNNITSEDIYKPEGPQEFEGSTPPQQRQTKHRPRQPTQPDFGQKITVTPLRDPSIESERQRKENYQEALRQQIKDKAEDRRREKKERELYEAKKVSEMMAYNPWGRAGGGAPLIDQTGNLITQLNEMHKLNKQIYRNCNLNNIFRLSRAGSPQDKPLPGLEQLGNKEPEHLQQQDRYKESLKQQIEENRRKRTEEKERQKILEEKEEKRLAEERARIPKGV
ncbi:centrosome and spindle pole-associated protein 1 [Boleophthalmus pectinirostris]|uniref:centrosome and spindle pole-associated protein 1 n=1 Tax=Boleophthalmus pectinirostris TaxID=150288 RepID=UPI0024308525|nr:centrosome and spindle pole-associated protein 1 [Boleophthalmus pectinirostris]